VKYSAFSSQHYKKLRKYTAKESDNTPCTGCIQTTTNRIILFSGLVLVFIKQFPTVEEAFVNV
jgi:hypothetical protein